MLKSLLVALLLLTFAGCSQDTAGASGSQNGSSTKNGSSSSSNNDQSSIAEFLTSAYTGYDLLSSDSEDSGILGWLFDSSSSSSSADEEDSSWYDSIFSDWFGDDNDNNVQEDVGLVEQLKDLATSSESREQFIVDGIDYSVEYVVSEYFPDFMYNTLMSLEFLKGKNLIAGGSALIGYMGSLYDGWFGASSAPRRAEAIAEEKSLIQLIIDEIYNMIMDWLWPSTEGTTPIQIDPNDMIDPSIPVDFNSVGLNLKSKVFYVASATYMTITMDDSELKGRGEIGFGVGEDFTYTTNGDGTLDIDMAGLYKVNMTYYDPNYCIAVEMLDTQTDKHYDAYWFLDEDVYDSASNMKLAEEKCFIRREGYSAPVVAVDGDIEPIKDERVGHSPVSGSSTADLVSTLVNGVDNTASITDAKYFARKMRHGLFSIYTTNDQTDTLQATETEKIKRELLPLVASSGLGLQELMGNSYDASIAFQDEVNNDLGNSFNEINGRLDELITAISTAIENTSSTKDGSATTPTYGDKVLIHAKVTGTKLLQNYATADVTMTITNPANNGRDADIVFTTQIETTVFGDGAINFDKVTATHANNYLSSSEYKLTVDTFSYVKESGIMNFTGAGYLGNTSRFNIDNYTIVANFPYDTLTLESLTATVDGKITTVQGRKFDGTLVFDGDNSSNSAMNGTLIGINNEPTISGFVKTSLNTTDITDWYTSTDTTQQVVNNLGDQSYTMKVNVTSKDGTKTASTDMLVQHDDSVDKWYYNINNIDVEDQYGTMKADSINFVQNGANNLSDTLDKLILSGMSTDSDLNALVNLGWDVASDFSEIGIEGLDVVMKPASGDVVLKSTIHVNNEGYTMSADMDTTYDYAKTHLSGSGDFTTIVDTSTGHNVYTNTFTTKGMIKEDLRFNYLYEIDYTDDTQYMLFTREDSDYQMGFMLNGSDIKGGDSYGVKADFYMNDSYDVLNGMELRDNSGNPLGIYNRSDNALQIIFSDLVKEYMYLY